MKRGKLKSMTVAEASDFFDEYDIFEFDDVKEVTDVKFNLSRKKYVGVDIDLYRKIRNKAKKLHIFEDDLIKEWLEEKVG
jgi:muconolactone delta-isomerase